MYPEVSLAASEFLEEVNAAILAVLTRGQDVTVNGKRYTRANLAELRQLRKELQIEVAAEARSGGIRLRQVVPRG